MDTLFHFIFSVIIGLAVFRGKHKLTTVAALAFLSVLVDLDHFFGLGARGTFHNIFIVFFIPLLAFVTFYWYEGRKSIKLQTYALGLMVMLTGHVVADMFYGGSVKLLYPFSVQDFSVPNISLLATDRFYSPIVSRDGIALAIYTILMLPAFFVEDFIYFFEKRHQRIRRAISNALNDLV